MFFQSWRHSDIQTSCSQSGLLISPVTDIPTFFTSLLLFLTCSEFLWRIVLSVIHKTGLYASNGEKDGSWCNFFNVWRIKKEITVSRFSIICTILCSNVWFVWNHTRFGFLKTCKPYFGPYYGQFMIFMYAIPLYGQFVTSTPPYVTICDLVFVSCFLYGGQPGLTKSFEISWHFEISR